jgi:DNA-binding NtrC family response regulator
VESIKQGIHDYLQKPFEPECLLISVERTFKDIQLQKEIRNLRQEVDEKYAFANIVGKNHKMKTVYSLIKKVAPTNSRVFITGETGVGKELVAKAIHFNSPRKNKPFVGINCGALPETLLESELFGYEKGAFTGADKTKIGKFEYAQGGTVFLDEIGEISPRMQVELLRVLQEERFERLGGNESIKLDVRIISATNQDINTQISNKQFRVELFYRLNVVPIHIPPLRERIDDIPLLVQHFINIFNKKFEMHIIGVSNQTMEKLMQHSWPGNVRELENVLERAFITTDKKDIINSVLFPLSSPGMTHQNDIQELITTEISFPLAKSLTIKRFEQSYFSEALKRCQYNVTATAKKIGVNPRTLWRKIHSYGIDLNQSQGSNHN